MSKSIRITFDHRNGDKATGTELMISSRKSFDEYRKFVLEASITDKMTTEENAKIGSYQRKNSIIWGNHESRLTPNGIELVCEKERNPYKQHLTFKMEERIKTYYKLYLIYRDFYYAENASETDMATAINRAGRDACKAISGKGIWSGMTSKAAFELQKTMKN